MRRAGTALICSDTRLSASHQTPPCSRSSCNRPATKPRQESMHTWIIRRFLHQNYSSCCCWNAPRIPRRPILGGLTWRITAAEHGRALPPESSVPRPVRTARCKVEGISMRISRSLSFPPSPQQPQASTPHWLVLKHAYEKCWFRRRTSYQNG